MRLDLLEDLLVVADAAIDADQARRVLDHLDALGLLGAKPVGECLHCRRVFVGAGAGGVPQRYCSPACRALAWRKGERLRRMTAEERAAWRAGRVAVA